MSVGIALRCPGDATHGALVPVKDATSRFGWYCPHGDHDGRLARHALGEAPRTRAFFTTAEADPASRRRPNPDLARVPWGDLASRDADPAAAEAPEPISAASVSDTGAGSQTAPVVRTHPDLDLRAGRRRQARSGALPGVPERLLPGGIPGLPGRSATG